MCLKVLIGDKLVTCICAYAPQTGRSAEEKDPFWDQMISVTGSIPASELIVVGGDLNGHIGTNVDGYDGVHGGYGFGERNADGERILEFCDAMKLIKAKGKASSLDIAPLTILNSGALQPRKWQLTGNDFSTAAHTVAAQSPH